MSGARPEQVSPREKRRQCDEMGTLGSGNYYLEIQVVSEVYDEAIAAAYGLSVGAVARPLVIRNSGSVRSACVCARKVLDNRDQPAHDPRQGIESDDVGTVRCGVILRVPKEGGVRDHDRRKACAPVRPVV